MKIKMFYREKKKPDNMGEGRELSTLKSAEATVEWHNKAFKRFHHWFEVQHEDAE